MPKKKLASKSQKKEKASWIGFINYTPTDEDKQLIKSGWVPTPVQMFGTICNWIDDGYKISVGWDDYSNCYQLTLTGHYADNINAGLGLSARHTDLHTCMGMLTYIVEEIFEKGAWSKDMQTHLEFDW